MARTNISYFDPGPVLARQRRHNPRPETDREFARRIGVARETVSRWRQGTKLYRSTAESVAIRLDCHPLDLWPDIATLDEDWRERARCKGTQGRFHLADEGVAQRDMTQKARAKRAEACKLRKRAQAMCARCPVRVACLDWVLRNIPDATDVGIWASTTRNQRKRMRKALQLQKVA